MVNCDKSYIYEKCENIFKTNWQLQRHLRKKKNCDISLQDQYKTQENTRKYNNSRDKTQENTGKYNNSQDNTQNKGHIYVIWTREFKTQNLPIYKIGRTSQNITNKGTCKRLEQYPKDSEQVMSVAVDNCIAAETELMNEL